MSRLRRLRGLLAVLLAVAYLGAGVLHNAYACVQGMAATTEVAFTMSHPGGGQDNDQSGMGEHHCHGCFSVAPVLAMTATSLIEPIAAPVPPPVIQLAGVSPALDTPPPKA
jgi:hypothetical protein